MKSTVSFVCLPFDFLDFGKALPLAFSIALSSPFISVATPAGKEDDFLVADVTQTKVVNTMIKNPIHTTL